VLNVYVQVIYPKVARTAVHILALRIVLCIYTLMQNIPIDIIQVYVRF